MCSGLPTSFAWTMGKVSAADTAAGGMKAWYKENPPSKVLVADYRISFFSEFEECSNFLDV